MGNMANSTNDAGQARLVNLGDPVNPQDAVNLRSLAVHPSAGSLLAAPTVLTSGTGTYQPPVGARHLLIEMIGGGGGGGGAGDAALSSAAGSGGQAGCYCLAWVSAQAGAITYAVGAGGTGAATGPNNGGNGGNTTITIPGPTVYTAIGGAGGAGGEPQTSTAITLPAPGNGPSTGGLVNGFGQTGQPGILTGGLALSGSGGSTAWGAGGVCGAANSATAPGAAATAPGGGGGGGANSLHSGTATGGAGASGIIVIYAYS